jgi:predicted aspartyl protease
VQSGANPSTAACATQSHSAPASMRCLCLAVTATLMSLSSARASAAACQLIQVAELPVTMAGNAPLVSVSINGQPAMMLLDTGASNSLLLHSAAKAMRLAVQQRGESYGAGGSSEAGSAWIKDFSLAGATVHDLNILVTGPLTTTPLGFVGLLGEDLLSHWDMELDLSAGKVRLFSPKNCTGDQVVYWAPAYFMAELLPDTHTNWLRATVQLNGHEIEAMFDSGASRSVVTTDAVRRAALIPTSSPAASESARGIAGKEFRSEVAIFSTLSIGQETIQNAQLRIADLFGKDTRTALGSSIPQMSINAPEMLVGADFFLARRVYVARSQGKIYFTYKGGPIFRTDEPGPPAPPATASPAEAGGSDPKQD